MTEILLRFQLSLSLSLSSLSFSNPFSTLLNGFGLIVRGETLLRETFSLLTKFLSWVSLAMPFYTFLHFTEWWNSSSKNLFIAGGLTPYLEFRKLCPSIHLFHSTELWKTSPIENFSLLMDCLSILSFIGYALLHISSTSQNVCSLMGHRETFLLETSSLLVDWLHIWSFTNNAPPYISSTPQNCGELLF